MTMVIEEFDNTVLAMMREFPSVSATYKQYVDSVYNPSTGTMSQVEVATSVQAILLDLTLRSNGLGTRFGTEIMAGDKQLLVRPPHKDGTVPQPLTINTATDRVNVGGHDYKIVTLKEINPTGTDPILYDLYIRR
jgi:hypothetical protein